MINQNQNQNQNQKNKINHLLTSREIEICKLVARGLSNEQIAKLLFLSEGTVKNHISTVYKKVALQNRAQLAAVYITQYEQVITDTSEADGYLAAHADARLRLVGLVGLPKTIPLIFQGRPFILGRFDVSVGIKQYDFEFDKSTKAVSRRHAAIEHGPCGYSITDLGSKAGTFVNGEKISEPCLLKNGDRVSFGNSGADYIFESET